jgi:hypothetical protein
LTPKIDRRYPAPIDSVPDDTLNLHGFTVTFALGDEPDPS